MLIEGVVFLTTNYTFRFAELILCGRLRFKRHWGRNWTVSLWIKSLLCTDTFQLLFIITKIEKWWLASFLFSFLVFSFDLKLVKVLSNSQILKRVKTLLCSRQTYINTPSSWKCLACVYVFSWKCMDCVYVDVIILNPCQI